MTRIGITGSVVLALTLTNCFAQVVKGARQQESTGRETSVNWGDKNLAAQLAKNIQAGPKIALQNSGQSSTSATLALLKQQRQSAAAAANSNKSGVTGVQVSPPSKAVAPTSVSLGPGKTDTATGKPEPGAQRIKPGIRPSESVATSLRQAPPPIANCMRPGISDVDGSPTGIVFSPGYSYVIRGCGFGNQPGSVYLTGVKEQTAPLQGFNVSPPPLHSDWVRLGVPGGDKHQTQLTWTDSRIEVVVDPNTTGFYDSNTATLVVILSDNITQLQAHGFTFFAARAQQTLTSLPHNLSTAGFTPARITDGSANLVPVNLVSPSSASLVLPGHTFAVVREDNAASFTGGTDTIDLINALQYGFEVSAIQLSYAALTQAMCPQTYSTNGSWNAARLGGPDRISISWQEQSCGKNGVSAYALDVFVDGPRGVSPF